jgi:alpha-N-arabinofuranosidase
MIIQNNIKRISLILCMLLLLSRAIQAREYHVSAKGGDTNKGTAKAPFQTISKAAEIAQPGDVITVHEGTYRERIYPPRGGESDTKRIVYRAAPGEKAIIKGSEVIKDWQKVQNDTWKVSIPNSFFVGFNPYSDLIHGDWFNSKGRKHHTGAVYLNGHWLTEAAGLDDVLKPIGNSSLWFGQVDETNTKIWAQFRGVNPNETDVEINVRQAVFYPEKTGINYITVRGFTMMHAATPWAPPTAEQIGLIGTHWSKGWIIEDNDIRYSTCVGVTLGKYGDQWDNTSQNTAKGYVKTIERALEKGWSRENIGHHIVRNNNITHCEQAGIVGSLGAVFSSITGNVIHDIHVRRLFTGAEMAGIKIHASIDTVIRNNHIYRTCRGIWMDWMAQGTRIAGNLCYNNTTDDLFCEVNHGPYLIENNMFLSKSGLKDWSQGGAYIHNLVVGSITLRPQGRTTPYHLPHSTELVGLKNILGGDDRFYNNIFVAGDTEIPANKATQQGYGLRVYNKAKLPMQVDGNVYYKGAKPYIKDQSYKALDNTLVTTNLLGKAMIPGQAYENPDGTPLKIDTDYFGKKRSEANPSAGPFENPGEGKLTLKVW